MYRSFADFSRTTPLPSDYLVGYRPNQGEFQVDFYTISNLISGGLWNTPNVLYVTVSGSDTNIGTAENYAFRSIKRACQVAALNPSRQYTIFVKTGDYYEFHNVSRETGDTTRNNQKDVVGILSGCKQTDGKYTEKPKIVKG